MDKHTKTFLCYKVVLFLFSILTLQMSLTSLNASAGTRLTGVDGQQVAYFDNNGDIYLEGGLRQNVIVASLPSQAKWWIKDGSSIIALIALEAMTINVSGTPSQIDLVAGDMVIRGSLRNMTDTHTAKWTLSEGSTQLCHFDAAGNLYLKNPPSGQTLTDKIHPKIDIFEIMQARIISPPFTYHPSEALNMVTRGGVYNVSDQFVTSNPPPNTNLTSDDNYRYMNTAIGDGDNWTSTYIGDDDSGDPILIIGNTDGHGLSYKVEYANRYFQTSTNTSVFDWPRGAGYDINPNIAINRLIGRPGNMGTMNITYTGTQPTETMTANTRGKTIARFLDWDIFRDTVNQPTLTPEQIEATFGEGFTGVFSYYAGTMVNPNSLLGVTDRMGNQTLYMAVSKFNNGRALQNKINRCYILTSKAEGGHAIGERWQPSAANPNNTKLLNCQPSDADNAMVWPATSHEKFKIPIFIQFGKAYQDYKDAPLEENAQKIWDQPTDGGYYVYAISPRGDRYFFTSELFLGRVKVRHGYPEDVWRNQGADWEYWAGTAKDGKQIWVSDPKDAVEFLYSYNELAWPSIMYHKPSNRFLMATFTASDKGDWGGRGTFGPEPYLKEPQGARFDTRWFLWEAPYPWGPWKKIMSNDYHGRQNDVHGLTDDHGSANKKANLFGYSGYTVQLVPAWMENNTTDGGWNIWALHSGFKDFTGSGEFGDNASWYEGKPYNFELVKIHLSLDKSGLQASQSALSNYQQNTWRQTCTDTISVGVLFQAHKNVEITHLGRYYETLNRHKHNLSLIEVNAAANLSLPATVKSGGLNISNVEVDMANRTLMDEHGFIYAPIPASAPDKQLQDGHWYVLVTEEGPCNNSVHAGTGCLGDQYYGKYDATDSDKESSICASMTDMRCGRVVEARRGASGVPGSGSWTLLHDLNKPLSAVNIGPGTHPGNSIGLVNLLFTDPGAPLNFAGSPQTSGRPTMTGEIFAGCRFELQKFRSSETNTTPLIKAKGDIIVTHLGRYKLNGNCRKHEVRLIHYEPGKTYNAVEGTITRPQRYVTVAQAVVDLSGGNVGEFAYAKLKTPVRISPSIPLRPETEVVYNAPVYYLVSRECTDAGEIFHGALDSGNLDAYGNPRPGSLLPQITVDAGVFDASVRVKPGYFKVVNGALAFDGGGWVTSDPGGNSSLGLVDLLYK